MKDKQERNLKCSNIDSIVKDLLQKAICISFNLWDDYTPMDYCERRVLFDSLIG